MLQIVVAVAAVTGAWLALGGFQEALRKAYLSARLPSSDRTHRSVVVRLPCIPGFLTRDSRKSLVRIILSCYRESTSTRASVEELVVSSADAAEALQWAALQGSLETVRDLVRKYGVGSADGLALADLEPALFFAASRGHGDVLQVMLQEANRVAQPDVILAVLRKQAALWDLPKKEHEVFRRTIKGTAWWAKEQMCF
jgi:hypothetical protein